jgi:hypothetical protein
VCVSLKADEGCLCSLVDLIGYLLLTSYHSAIVTFNQLDRILVRRSQIEVFYAMSGDRSGSYFLQAVMECGRYVVLYLSV